jgi:hypothetical protein
MRAALPDAPPLLSCEATASIAAVDPSGGMGCRCWCRGGSSAACQSCNAGPARNAPPHLLLRRRGAVDRGLRARQRRAVELRADRRVDVHHRELFALEGLLGARQVKSHLGRRRRRGGLSGLGDVGAHCGCGRRGERGTARGAHAGWRGAAAQADWRGAARPRTQQHVTVSGPVESTARCAALQGDALAAASGYHGA